MDTRIFDRLLEGVNALPKYLIDNQFIAFGSELSAIAHALIDAKNEVLKQNDKMMQLEKQIRDLSAEAVGTKSVEKDK